MLPEPEHYGRVSITTVNQVAAPDAVWPTVANGTVPQDLCLHKEASSTNQ